MLGLLYAIIMYLMYVRFKKAKSVAVIMVVFITLTGLGSYFIGQMPSLEEISDILMLAYTCLVIFLMCDGYKGYSKVVAVSGTEGSAFQLFSKSVLIFSLFSIAVNGFLLTMVLPMISDFGAWKGDMDEQQSFFYNLPIPHWFITLSSILSAFSLFALPLHFYYLQKKEKKKAIWFGVGSLAMIVKGLLLFSRSAFVEFGLLYMVYTFLFYNSFTSRIKKLLKRLFVCAAVGAVLIFTAISSNRFDDTGALKIHEKSIIQDDVLYSYVDYGCQWFGDNFELARLYNYQPLGGTLSNAFIRTYFTHSDPSAVKDLRVKLWGGRATAFIGLYCIWLFDFGYIGSILLSLLFWYIAKRLRPKNGVMSTTSLFSVSVLLLLPLMSFSGNLLETTWYHDSLIILAIYALFAKNNKKRKIVSYNMNNNNGEKELCV